MNQQTTETGALFDLPITRVRLSLLATRIEERFLSRFRLRNLLAGRRQHASWKTEVQGTIRVIATPAMLTGNVCAWLAREAKGAALARQTLVIDLSATVRAEADGLGGLLEARRILLADDLWIWLAGMSNPIRRVLQFSAIAELFRIAATAEDAVRRTNASAPAISKREGGGEPSGGRRAGTVPHHPIARAS